MEKYRCAIIGQHPMRFPWGFDEEDTQCRRMKLELAQCIMELRQCGVTEFQVACDPGVGLYAGEIVNITKQNDEAMRLVCVTPFEEQATKWTPQLRERYFDMLADCTDLSCVDYQETPNAQLMAYRRIVKQSDMLLAVYDPELASGSAEDKAMAYALALGKPTLLIHPNTWKKKWLNVVKREGEEHIQKFYPSSYFRTIYILQKCGYNYYELV